MSNPDINYHPIIGLVVLACLALQPFLGVIHHIQFKRLHRRQIWSYLHLFNGRLALTLGIVNGGIGLWISRASDRWKTVYVALSAAMWAIWMLVAGWGEWRRWRKSHESERKRLSDTSVAF